MPKQIANKDLMYVYFIKNFIKIIENPKNLLISIDEMGIGTNPLRHYAYSKIGQPCVLKYKRLLCENLTATAAISLNGLEMVQFIYETGQSR